MACPFTNSFPTAGRPDRQSVPHIVPKAVESYLNNATGPCDVGAEDVEPRNIEARVDIRPLRGMLELEAAKVCEVQSRL